MTTKEIIELLKARETEFSKIKSFSEFPGIYAFFYIGNDFPIIGNSVSKHQIIYIGKTESSQENRDAKTHFTTGKTGSSTVRKSIGSILCSQKNLIPIPRNNSDYERGSFSHFKYDKPSEELITNWMKNNLAVSFYEYPESKKLIDELETRIIKQLKPILNIDYKNPENPYKVNIKQLRKNCALVALKNSDFKKLNPGKKGIRKKEIKSNPMAPSSSGIIYIDNITKRDIKSRSIRIKVDNKYLFPTEKSGNPISHSLNFKIGNTDFIAKYTIGSKDGKSRSGILKIGDIIYQETLKIGIGTNLKISKSKDNKYTIEKS